MSWEDYGVVLENLYKKVQRYIQTENIRIDAVVPVLRGGAFPGAYLTFKLHLLRILSVQYKYFFVGKKIQLRKVLDFPKIGLHLPRKPNFLLVENNHCFGLTAFTAAKDLRQNFPDCKIIYAADHIDYSYQKNDYADAIFYGRLTNETRVLAQKECKAKKVENISYLFPWEDLDEEWITVKGKQFQYQDLKSAFIGSRMKAEVDNE